jgi:cyclopropane-fatty-acyl-phospholipid synthase
MPRAILEQAQAPAFQKSERSLYESMVLKALSGLTRGFLRLTLPSGEELSIGLPEAEIKASITVRSTAFFRKCVLFGDVGFGEAYVDGDWDTDDITRVISWMILNIDNHPSMSGSRKKFSSINWLRLFNKMAHLFRPNTFGGSQRNIREHYDLSNDFFKLILDETMAYSSGYFEKSDETLEAAQHHKYEKLCEKLQLKPSDHLLEIGSGWAGFAVYAALHYGCKITTITISQAQYDFALKKIQAAGLTHRINLQLKDYRKLSGRFNKIVSIEMLEAVGHEFLEAYFQKCQDLLTSDGILALQVITCPDSRYDKLRKGVDWIQKYIFPGSLLPSVAAINKAVNRTGDLVLHDLEDLSKHYKRTLSVWRDHLNSRWPQVRALGFDDRFKRKWNYYLSYCEAAFDMRNIAVLQIVYTRPNNHKL